MEKAYETYKNSGVEWIGEIPESWNVNLLKRGLSLLTDYEANGSFSSVKQNVNFPDKEEDEYAWYVRATDLEKKTYGDRRNLRWVDKETYNFLERTTLYGNELLVAKRGEIGKIYIMPEVKIPSTLAPNLYLLRFNNKINSKFAYYYFQSELGSEELKSKNRSTTIGAVYKDDLKDIKFIYPSLQEQTQIAAYLDYHTQLIDTLISKKETLIQKLQEQRQAIINEAVTKGLNKNVALKDSGIEWLGDIPEHWTIAKFKYFAKIRNGKDQKSVLVDDGKYPILGTGGEFGRSSEFLYDKPSVLLGRKGTIDKPQFIEEPFWTVDTLFYTEIESDVVPKFLFYLSTLIPFSLLQESSAVPSMTQDKLHNVFLTKPSYDEQLSIVAFLESELNKLNVLNQLNLKQIQKLKAYRQSLISEAVTGKIDVRDWQQPKNKS
ncbi:restriction endonuclease subunit S [Tenacibaculum maritimum]|uniref:restriction endonuclease subunit S n=1 Tax=Tenacibaculum maritimum TaxID=107401 RepID=UPI0012E66578|nr:restriction endonuclease subunit S [Tenacibaculum maritimum]CAA0210651.1 Type I restriction enzyme, S subunit [Tenacibaculum maritimum]